MKTRSLYVIVACFVLILPTLFGNTIFTTIHTHDRESPPGGITPANDQHRRSASAVVRHSDVQS
jgi:hypothetical protein